MTESLKVSVARRDGLAIISAVGYINKQGGEAIAKLTNELIDEGYQAFLFNLAGTTIVNNYSTSTLTDFTWKVFRMGGTVGFCCLRPTIKKTFQLMGVTQHATVFPDEDTAVASLLRGRK